MTSTLVEKLSEIRDLKKILETTAKEVGESFHASSCQVVLSNPLDSNTTSICEYKSQLNEKSNHREPSVSFPLALHGAMVGQIALEREPAINNEEANQILSMVAQLGEIIRHAQIDDIVQRDTFRKTFLGEIENVMSYSLGIGDAMFMVVNILGKVLQVSRCIFICTDDTQVGWKCYEYWQQGQVQSCQHYRWPTADSTVVAQSLLSTLPLVIYEGQINSHVMPVQEELQFIGVRSCLGIPLKSEAATHGCVILQQCDYRRAWTRGEIDMVQSVADKVASALIKLPAEKLAREPIMQLHQQIVAVPKDKEEPETIQSVRQALKEALGQQTIPSASKTSMPPPSSSPATTVKPVPDQFPEIVEGGTTNTAAAQTPQKTGDVTPGAEGKLQVAEIEESVVSKWGDLDSIPTPSGTAAPGLSASMLNKARGSGDSDSPLFASLHKDKSKLESLKPQVEFVEAAPIQIDEVSAQSKLKEILSNSNPTTDYIFNNLNSQGLDIKTLGRIDGWINQIEDKDKYVNGYTKQIAEYAVAIAKKAGLTPSELDTVRLAALLHEVGKLGTSSYILQKPDEDLTDTELLILMKHPLDGAELLESFADLAQLGPIIRSVHEEYDGNGYPSGLKGEEIPKIARIIFVASTYQSLVSPLKSASPRMSVAQAQEELINGAEKQYDPHFVRLLIQVIDESGQ